MKRIAPPEDIQIIGNELAIRWADGREDYIPVEVLRALSPSAENMGEPDILGRIHGGTPGADHSGVTVDGWNFVGGYAIRFKFSDGHQTGLYSYRYLLDMGDAVNRERGDDA